MCFWKISEKFVLAKFPAIRWSLFSAMSALWIGCTVTFTVGQQKLHSQTFCAFIWPDFHPTLWDYKPFSLLGNHVDDLNHWEKLELVGQPDHDEIWCIDRYHPESQLAPVFSSSLPFLNSSLAFLPPPFFLSCSFLSAPLLLPPLCFLLPPLPSSSPSFYPLPSSPRILCFTLFGWCAGSLLLLSGQWATTALVMNSMGS